MPKCPTNLLIWTRLGLLAAGHEWRDVLVFGEGGGGGEKRCYLTFFLLSSIPTSYFLTPNILDIA